MGTIIFGLGLLFFLLAALFVSCVAVYRGIRANPSTKPSWRKSGMFVGTLALIALAEAVLPSLRLTGLERAPEIIAPEHMSAIAFSDAPLTYAGMSRAAPFLWRLGEITEAEMRARLETDIEIATRVEQANQNLAAQGKSFDRAAMELFYSWSAMNSGLRAARADLDRLFGTGSVPVSAATVFVLEHVETAFDALSEEAETRLSRVKQQQTQTLATFGDEARINDPVLVDLARAVTDAEAQGSAVRWARWDLDRRARDISRGKEQPDARQPFPSYPHPLILTSRTRSADLSTLQTLSGPAPDITSQIYARISDAVTGRLRHPKKGQDHFACAISVRGGTAEPFCLLQTQLAVNYDVTGAGCAEPDVDGLCLERWIFPYLNILMSPDTLTLLPIRSSAEAPLSTLSQWTVTWQGQTHLLDAPVTLPWSADINDIKALEVTHAPRPDLVAPGIWQELRRSFPGDDLSARASAPPHPFTAQKVPEVSVRFLFFGDIFQLVQVAPGDADRPHINVDMRLDRLKHLSNFTQEADGTSTRCSSFEGIVFDELVNDLDPLLLTFVSSTPDGNCAAYQGYIQVLQAVKQARQRGSFLWLVETR